MALASSTVTATSLASLLETTYRPRMALATTESMNIANKFDAEGTERIANGMVIRKVAAKNRITAAVGDHLDTADMTFEADTEAAVTLSPTFIYGAVGLSKHSQTRLLASAEYQRGVREQLTRTLSEEIDETAGELGDNLATSVIGGAQNLDKTLLLSGMAILRENAKRYYNPSTREGTAYLCVHPRQMHHLYSIAEIANANLRGDGANPNVSGVLVEAWGLNVGISGNVVNSGGFLHNMLFLKEAFALGYNERPQLAPEQWNGLTLLLMSYAEFGVVEVWDEYGVDIRTNNTAIS